MYLCLILRVLPHGYHSDSVARRGTARLLRTTSTLYEKAGGVGTSRASPEETGKVGRTLGASLKRNDSGGVRYLCTCEPLQDAASVFFEEEDWSDRSGRRGKDLVIDIRRISHEIMATLEEEMAQSRLCVVPETCACGAMSFSAVRKGGRRSLVQNE